MSLDSENGSTVIRVVGYLFGGVGGALYEKGFKLKPFWQ
jgi:hypothetical protein